MTKSLKIGVIGLGEQMWDNLLPSILFNKTAIVDSICDIDEEKLFIAKQKYNAVGFKSYKEMLNSRQLDCLVVASYPQVHEKVIQIALDQAIPIFIEKPPVTNLAKLKILMKHANFSTLISGIGINFSYTETLLILKKLLKEEGFGKIIYLNISHLANKPIKPLWKLDNLSQSFLLAQAIHPLSFALNFGEKHKATTIDYKQYGNLFLLNLKLKIINNDNSFIANITTGTCSPHFEWQMDLITDKGKVLRINSLWELELLDSEKGTSLIPNTKRWKDVWHPSPVGNGLKRTGYYHELESFFDSVRQRKTFYPNLASMVGVYELIDQIDNNLVINNKLYV